MEMTILPVLTLRLRSTELWKELLPYKGSAAWEVKVRKRYVWNGT